MELKNYGNIQRAIGMISGVAVVADPRLSDVLDGAVELLEAALSEAQDAECETQNAEDIEPKVRRVIWHDAERYLPPEDGWYIGDAVGYEDSIPVWYRFGTQTFETTEGEDVKVVRWKGLAE